jgi:hypothetical protein
MSLATLVDMRRLRLRPAAVTVVLGTTHAWVKDWANYVVIAPADVPETMDLRALFGLPVILVEMERDDDRFPRVLTALEKAGARIEAIVTSAGPCGKDEEHERVLLNLRERLCI